MTPTDCLTFAEEGNPRAQDMDHTVWALVGSRHSQTPERNALPLGSAAA